MPKPRSSLSILILALAASCALLVPAAQGATVVNGSFETGTLQGWQIEQEGSFPAGNFFAYSGTTTPYASMFEKEEIEEFEECEAEEEGKPDPQPCREAADLHIFPPPSGQFAAVSDEFETSATALYQDVALEPYYSHTLSMTIFYKTYDELSNPSPETLSVRSEGSPLRNQQMRVDILKAGAPPRTVDPSDILATVFATKHGDPLAMAPSHFSVNLTPFAGQTVRIRVAVAVTETTLQGGIDDVSIASTPPSNSFQKGALKLNKKKGTASLQVTVPGAGVLSTGVKKKIKTANVSAAAAGAVTIPLRAIGKGLKTLKKSGKLAVNVPIAFTPTGGAAATRSFKFTLKKKLKPKVAGA